MMYRDTSCTHRSYGVQTISGSTFIGNQAGAVGGALYLNGGAALVGHQLSCWSQQ